MNSLKKSSVALLGRRLKGVAALWGAVVCCLSSLAGQSPATNILPNGDFETFGSRSDPVGWEMRPTNTKILLENGNHYLASEPVSPDELPWASTRAEIKTEWKRLRVTARMRVRRLKPGKESWQTARIGMRYEDKNGKLLGYAAAPEVHADIEWTTLSAESDIPEGTDHVVLDAGNFGDVGDVSFDDIQLQPITDAVAAPATDQFPADATLPAGERIYWGEEPVENLTSRRGRIVLNGLWKFQPGQAGAKEPVPVGWGYLRVPGSWRIGYSAIAIPQMTAPGSGPMWQAWQADALDQGWYERTLRIPAGWEGRSVLLSFARISTDAWVYLDGKEIGRVAWPAGEVNLTRFITPGREYRLRVFVATIPSSEQVGVYMGPGANQVSFTEARPESKGLIDDVVLESRPRKTYVSDVFVQPSTRRKQVTLDVELTNVTQAGSLKLVARMERGGKEEKTFEQTVNVQAKPVQTVKVNWPWADPVLWDLDKPHLYTLKLQTEGAGMDDEYAQEFGFREFWIDGKKCS